MNRDELQVLFEGSSQAIEESFKFAKARPLQWKKVAKGYEVSLVFDLEVPEKLKDKLETLSPTLNFAIQLRGASDEEIFNTIGEGLMEFMFFLKNIELFLTSYGSKVDYVV